MKVFFGRTLRMKRCAQSEPFRAIVQKAAALLAPRGMRGCARVAWVAGMAAKTCNAPFGLRSRPIPGDVAPRFLLALSGKQKCGQKRAEARSGAKRSPGSRRNLLRRALDRKKRTAHNNIHENIDINIDENMHY